MIFKPNNNIMIVLICALLTNKVTATAVNTLTPKDAYTNYTGLSINNVPILIRLFLYINKILALIFLIKLTYTRLTLSKYACYRHIWNSSY
jgi:hypothetical protein